MKPILKLANTTVLATGLLLAAPAFFPVQTAILAQSPRYEEARAVVDRTQTDLTRSIGLVHDGKELERYKNAQKKLSTFDRHLVKGKFDKGTLDSAIEDLQHVLDHNTLQGQDRDTLMDDVRRLRELREFRS
jgi:hypothetical protein